MKINLKLSQAVWAISFAFLSMFILGLADNIRGPLFPEVLNFFNLSSVKGSWSFATTSSAAFIGSYTSFHFLKRYSMSSLLLMAVACMGLGLFIMGYSAHFYVFIVGSFFLGLSIGWLGVAQNLLVSENVSAKNKSRALSALHSIYGLASFIAPVMAATMTDLTKSWSTAFLFISVLSFFYVLLQFCIKSDPPFGVLRISELEQADPLVVPRASLLFIGGLFAFYVVAEILVATRLAQYMRNYYEMDLLQSSQYVTYFFLFLLVGRIFFALVKIPFSTKKQMNASLVASIVLLLLGLNIHPLILTFVGLTMAPFYPLSVTYISEAAGDHARKFLTFAMAFQGLAVVSMHLGVGYLTDQLGLFYAFGVGVFALVLSLICLNLHPRKLY